MTRGRAARYTGAGGVEVIEIADIEVADPGPGQVAVDVAAAALNRADILQRRGLYPAPAGAPADIAGLELAGTVAALGPGVTGVAVGDRVMAIVGGGGMATRVNLHARVLVPAPANASLVEAAAIPEVFLTAYDAMFVQAGLGLGERVLIHAAGSGIGTAAIQLAARAGAEVIGTARSAAKLERCAELGLAHPIDASSGSFAAAVKEATRGRGVDVILDTVGGSYLAENLMALAPLGRMVTIGLLGGPMAPLNLGAMLTRRLEIRGSVLRARPLEEKAALAQRVGRTLVPMFERGELVAVIDEVFPMSELAAAQQRMEDNANVGKIVLEWA
jgi:putative PIG3 family NAD(P)H quinone oxidoreductase